MRKFSFKFLAALALCGAMATGTAWAKDHEQGGGKGHNRDRSREHAGVALEHRQGKPAVLGTAAQQPPGWDKGRKTGWGDCDVPPGQAKKAGCQPVRSHRARRRTEWRESRRREEAREAQRRQERRAAWQRAHQRREQTEAARRNTRTRAVLRDPKRDRDHDRQ